MSYNNIYFFNFWQNGDIHVARNFIKVVASVARTYNPRCGLYFVHKNPQELLEDIPYIQTIGFKDARLGDAFQKINTDMPSVVYNSDLYVNTWYGADRGIHLRANGITFDCLYDVFDSVLRTYLKTEIASVCPDALKLFPSVEEHNMSDVAEMDRRLEAYSSSKKILVCNGNAISGYAKNIDIVQPVIDTFGSDAEYKIFYTNPLDKEYGHDLIDIGSITTKKYNLLQIGYLARYFDVVIGRASGPSTYSINKEVIFDRNVICNSYCKLPPSDHMWIGPKFLEMYGKAKGKMNAIPEDNIYHSLKELYGQLKT